MPAAMKLGPTRGRITLRTHRDGVAAQAGHDLVLEVDAWSAQVALPDADPAQPSPPTGSAAGVEARIDLGSLRVVDGTGGIKPLTDRDRREITANARKALDVEHYAEALFRSTSFSSTETGGVLDGEFTLHGVTRPLRLEVTRLGGGRVRATGVVRQTEHGVKPYTAFFGALKLRDEVEVEIEADLGVDAEPAG